MKNGYVRKKQLIVAQLIAVMFLFILIAFPAWGQQSTHGISIYDKLLYPSSFKHLNYVNPNAPKGGGIKLGAVGGFDNFNPFSIKGRGASGIGLLYDSLTSSPADDPFSSYGLLAESLTLSKDRKKLTYRLKAHARWHDGKPITVDDVLFSYQAARSPQGPPLYRQYYADITKIEKTGPRDVTFFLANPDNNELPLVIGQLPILPRHFWEKRDITKTSLDLPLGSGPYRINSFEANRFVEYQRQKNYWGRNEPIRRGFYNFDSIRYDYYRDSNVIIEALKSGDIDFRSENASKAWATAYNIPAVEKGDLIKARFAHKRVIGMQGYVFNQRRAIFQDRAIRKAIAYAFDFEWANKALFYGQYARSRSYFGNSELEALDRPTGATVALLEKWRNQLPKELFNNRYTPPRTDISGGLRQNLKEASIILKNAGWGVNNGKRTNNKDGTILNFEIMLFDPQQERIALPFAQNLKKLGITASIRTVDAAQYVQRLEKFDFDMVVSSWPQSRNPGNEQYDMWGSQSTKIPGSSNLSGVASPVIDDIIKHITSAQNRDDLKQAVRALDHVLQWEYLVVPHFQIDYDRILYWNRFKFPKTIPDSGINFNTWWIDSKLPLNQKNQP